MRWITSDKYRTKLHWHRWFAWYPVCVAEYTDTGTAIVHKIWQWLCYVERKFEVTSSWDGASIGKIYREIVKE